MKEKETIVAIIVLLALMFWPKKDSIPGGVVTATIGGTPIDFTQTDPLNIGKLPLHKDMPYEGYDLNDAWLRL